jgi:hypothetical protein
MITLTDFRAHALTILGDLAGNRYSDTLLNEAVRLALSEYSLVCPNISTTAFTVPVSGKVQNITGLSNFQFFTRVQWPSDPDPQANLILTWQSAFDGEIPQIRFLRDTPQAGDILSLTYTALHTISGLDGAVNTTLPAAHTSQIALGTAAHAAIIRSTQISEQMSSRVSNSTQLANWGRERLAEFHHDLVLLALDKTILNETGSWSMDGWD